MKCMTTETDQAHDMTTRRFTPRARHRWRALLLILTALVTASSASAAPAMSVSAAFEPRLGSYDALDDGLSAYGFAPVGSPFLPVWGLRGRAFFDGNGLFATFAMNAGVRVSTSPKVASPTVQNLSEFMGGVGYRLDSGLFAEIQGGFASHTMTVASSTDGGALVSLGPALHPRIGYSIQLFEPYGWFVAVVVGAHLHVPLGAPHQNPLWEEPFSRGAIGALTIGIESGFGLQTQDRP
jgi:hypothetical protein